MSAGGSPYRFTGRERVTLEVAGTFDPAALALPAGLAHDGGRVSLFAFAVEGLRIARVPLLRWSYPEILWRIAVRRNGAPAWWVVACDLAARGPRWAARRYVRYPVRPLTVAVAADRIASRGPPGELVLRFEVGAGAPADVARPLLTGVDASWQVPWGDDAEPGAPRRVIAEVDTLSVATVGAPIQWTGARLREGREHRCGVAGR